MSPKKWIDKLKWLKEIPDPVFRGITMVVIAILAPQAIRSMEGAPTIISPAQNSVAPAISSDSLIQCMKQVKEELRELRTSQREKAITDSMYRLQQNQFNEYLREDMAQIRLMLSRTESHR